LTSNSIRGLGYSGIGVDSNGNLSINDPDKLGESISNGSFARNFQGMNSFGQRLYDVTLTAHSTVYESAIRESYNNLMNSISMSASGDLRAGESFFPGMIFSLWA